MNTEGTGSHTYKECHKTESPWNHTSTAHKERGQLGDRRSDGESSCNSGDGTGQMAQPWMFILLGFLSSCFVPLSICCHVNIVRVVTRIRLDDRGFVCRFQPGPREVPVSEECRPALGPTKHPTELVPACLCSGQRPSGPEAHTFI
jgi:hypothetical protein